MQVVLFGAGAMACLFAARLASVAQVSMADDWTEALDEIGANGICIEEANESRIVRVRAEYLGCNPTPADLAIVLVKSWQTAQVADRMSDYLNPDGLAISLQNGIGNVEMLGRRAFPGATAEGATLLRPGHVRRCGSGPTHTSAPDWVVDLLQRAGFESYRCDPGEAEGLLWGKLSISCGINALTALLRVPNGELLKRPDAEALMVKAAEECAAVASAKGLQLPFPNVAARVREVAERTAGNLSSMLQDILRGAPTECDAINGAAVREGKRLGVSTPLNETLWQLVRAAAC